MIRKVFITNIIFAAIFLPTYFAAPAAAETTQGLNVEVYTYDPSSLPNHSAEGYQLCANAWTSSTNIFHNFDAEFQGIVAGCQGDFVLVHYSGYMTFPETADIVFLSQADDGFFMQLDDQIVLDDWWLKGCSGNSFTRTFEANVSQKLDVWFYEYGGGACNQLYMQSELGWTQIPDSVFTKESITVEPLDPALVQAAADLELAKTRLNELLAAYPADTDWSKIPEVISLQDSLAMIELAISNKDLAAVQLISSLNSSFDLASSAIEKFFTPVEPPIEPPVEPEPEPEPEPELPPVTPEPSPEPTIEPTPEPLPEPEIPTAEEAHAAEMLALMEAAQEDDLEVPSEIAALPVVGAVAEALISSINALGNVGADLTPEVREKAKKTIVSAIIVTQVAQLATGTALAASSSAAASSTSTRRN